MGYFQTNEKVVLYLNFFVTVHIKLCLVLSTVPEVKIQLRALFKSAHSIKYIVSSSKHVLMAIFWSYIPLYFTVHNFKGFCIQS